MTPQDWEHICALFEAATALSPDTREAYLKSLDQEPAWVLDELRSLLSAHEDEATVSPVVDVDLASIASQAARDAESPDLPQRVGAFRVDRELGRGGMGVVYLAHRDDGQFDQQVALKVVRRGVESGEVHQRFLVERQVLARLEHPAIARLLDGGLTDDGRPYFAMEYVQGQSLVAHCEAQSLSVGARLALFVEVCEAVQYAHDHLIIHRDIKPSNVLVDTAGHPRLLDFGIAKLLDEGQREQVTRTGMNLMTLQYASPEQLNGGPVGVASDVYQLGLLLYELLAGRLPFDVSQMGLSDVVSSICEKAMAPPSQHASGIPRDLDAIVHVALRKAPAERYSTVTALREDVQRFRAGRAVVARGQSPWYLLQRFIGRNRALSSVVAGSAVLMLAAVIVSLGLARQAREEAGRSDAAQAVLSDFIRQADPFGGSDAEGSLADAVVAGRDRVAGQVDGDPSLAFTVYAELTRLQNSLGLYDQALETARAAHAAAAQIAQPGPRRLQALDLLSETLVLTGAPREAAALLEEALSTQPASPEFSSAWVLAELERARAYDALRREAPLAQSLQRVERALREYEVADPEVLLEYHNQRGALARRRQDREAAEAERRTALAIARDLGGAQALAAQLNNLALDLARQRRYAEAEPLFQESIDIIERISPNHPRLAFHRNNYAGLLFRDGRREQAVAMVGSAMASMRTGSNRYWRYAVHRDFAYYALSAGAASAGVEANAQQMAIASEVFGGGTTAVVHADILLGRYAVLAGEYGFALALHDHVVETHPQFAGVDMWLEIAKILIDIGRYEDAELAYARRASEDSLVAQELRLQLDCAAGDTAAVRASLATLSGEEPNRGAERRVAVRIAIIEAVLAGDDEHWRRAVERYTTHAAYLTYLERTRLLAGFEGRGDGITEDLASEIGAVRAQRLQVRDAVQARYASRIAEMGVGSALDAFDGSAFAPAPLEAFCLGRPGSGAGSLPIVSGS
ncbi:MAG: serine/threonine-protein kinase [Pseudomonadota bacterium]